MPRAANGRRKSSATLGPNIFLSRAVGSARGAGDDVVAGPSRSSALRASIPGALARTRSRSRRPVAAMGSSNGEMSPPAYEAVQARKERSTRTRRGALVSSRTPMRAVARVRATVTVRREGDVDEPPRGAVPPVRRAPPGRHRAPGDARRRRRPRHRVRPLLTTSSSTRSGGTGVRPPRLEEGRKTKRSSSRRRSTSRRRDGGSSTAGECSSPCDNPRAASSSPRCSSSRTRRRAPSSPAEGVRARAANIDAEEVVGAASPSGRADAAEGAPPPRRERCTSPPSYVCATMRNVERFYDMIGGVVDQFA